ncbi:hypothetical protein V8D89_002935 [Ganoderma adspersum]
MLTEKLNEDVLVIVSEFLTDVPDVLSFSLTSSSLHPIATRRLLSMRPVSLTEDLSVENFHSFLFADAAIRTLHIRGLRIKTPKSPAEVANQERRFASLLVEIITACPQLSHVSIALDDDSIDIQSIVAAIAALKSLRSFILTGWSANALHIFHELSSPIRKLAIHSAYIRVPAELEEYLSRFAPTLEELELLYLRARQEPVVDDIPGSPEFFRNLTQYPAVRSLRVSWFHGPPVLDRLQHLFPALDGTLYIGPAFSMNDIRSCEGIRAENQRAQEGTPSHTWKKLDRLVCTASMLYSLALRCPIRHVMLDNCNAETLCYAAAALRENPVPRLKLTLRYGRGMLDGIFTPELAGTLTRLTLCLVYDNHEDPRTAADADDVAQLRWDDLLATLFSALRPLRNVSHLRLVLSCKVYTPPAPPWGSAYSEKFVDAVRASAFDFHGTAMALACTLPALRHVFLTTCGSLATRDEAVRAWCVNERWNASRAWRVADAEPAGSTEYTDGTQEVMVEDPTRRLVELHGDVAETIIRNEELVLSETDELELFPKEE